MAESLAKSIQAASTAAKQVAEVRASLSMRRSELAAQIAALQKRNDYVTALPVNREDGKRFVLDCIDVQARTFLKRAHYPQFIASFATPQRGCPSGFGRSDRPLSLDDVVAVRENDINHLGNGPTNFFVGKSGSINGLAVDADAMCFFFGDVMKKKLEAHLEDWFPDYTQNINARHRPQFHGHYKDATPEDLASTIEQRQAEIDRNNEKVEKLEQECSELDEALASLGAPAEEGARSTPVM